MFGRRRSPHERFEKAIGYSFRDRKLLANALVHRSYRFENREMDRDNQRLEFLGDAALGLVSAASLYDSFKDGDEGTLTFQRSLITSGRALAEIARKIGLGAELMLGKGEEKSGGRERESNLADGLEAVLGAAFLDGGLKAVEKIFRKIFIPALDSSSGDCWEGNPKGKLQETCQRLWHCGPQYRAVAEKGPSHRKTFMVEVHVRGEPMGRGRGASKRSAEAQAAIAALRRIGQPGG